MTAHDILSGREHCGTLLDNFATFTAGHCCEVANAVGVEGKQVIEAVCRDHAGGRLADEFVGIPTSIHARR